MKEVLSQNEVRYLYIDICESVGKLKRFLAMRDSEPAFAAVREVHRVGIPVLVVEKQVILIESPEHMERLIEELELTQT